MLQLSASVFCLAKAVVLKAPSVMRSFFLGISWPADAHAARWPIMVEVIAVSCFHYSRGLSSHRRVIGKRGAVARRSSLYPNGDPEPAIGTLNRAIILCGSAVLFRMETRPTKSAPCAPGCTKVNLWLAIVQAVMAQGLFPRSLQRYLDRYSQAPTFHLWLSDLSPSPRHRSSIGPDDAVQS